LNYHIINLLLVAMTASSNLVPGLVEFFLTQNTFSMNL